MKQKPFSFSADCKTLEQSIKRVMSVSGATAACYFLGVFNKAIYVFGLGADTFAMLEVPNATTDAQTGIFGFDAERLPGLIKGRAIMEFKYTGSEVVFSQTKGKFNGKIVPINITEDQLAQLTAKASEKVSAAALTADQLLAIKSGLAATAVKDVYQNTTLLSYITMSKDGKLTVSSFDAQHFGIHRIKLKTGAEFRAALPATHFSLIEQLANGGDMKFKIASSGLKASGKGFAVSLPATQAEDRHYSMVTDFLKALPKPVFECEFQVDKLAAIADNLYTLYNANANFAVKTKGAVLSIGLSTSSGSASDSVKVKPVSGKDTAFSVDPRLFMDLLALAKPHKVLTLRVMPKVLSLSGTTDDGCNISLSCSRVD